MHMKERRLWKMKSGRVSSYVVPAKRRGRGLTLAILDVIILSLLVPLIFLLSLHNGFHSTNAGFVFKDSGSPLGSFGNYISEDQNHVQDQLEDDNKSAHINDLMKRLESTLPKFDILILVLNLEDKVWDKFEGVTGIVEWISLGMNGICACQARQMWRSLDAVAHSSHSATHICPNQRAQISCRQDVVRHSGHSVAAAP
ncbi:hypothetical protein Sjap_004228 [Stephania japonica]|uniref:Uncharacterized protein n=1 Tax=Stephania japonica TaxID=461633 RepID=A0AAP0PK42_9MAGN